MKAQLVDNHRDVGHGQMTCTEMTVADMSENDEVLCAFPMFLCETSEGIAADWRDFAKNCINLY